MCRSAEDLAPKWQEDNWEHSILKKVMEIQNIYNKNYLKIYKLEHAFLESPPPILVYPATSQQPKSSRLK